MACKLALDRTEIRMEILLDYYRDFEKQTGIPEQTGNEKLKHVSRQNYESNYGYLVKSGMLCGAAHYSDDGVAHYVPTGDITCQGMDVVEKFIDGCVEISKKTRAISFSLGYLDKITELYKIWASNYGLFQKALELLASIIPNAS